MQATLHSEQGNGKSTHSVDFVNRFTWFNKSTDSVCLESLFNSLLKITTDRRKIIVKNIMMVSCDKVCFVGIEIPLLVYKFQVVNFKINNIVKWIIVFSSY